jgi:hypothetical protein
MNYTKPEVNFVGKALSVIESLNPPKISTDSDGARQVDNPAYDLDE